MPGIKPMKIIVPALLATATAYAVPYEKRGMDQVISQCNHNFAYTFDDGPYQWNTDLVNTFDAVGAKTTFFINGNNWGCIYSEANVNALRYAFEHGHEIASHTWSHPHLTTLSLTRIDEEIQRLDQALVKILGVRPKIFRPPYGEIDETRASYIQSKYGKTIVLWDLDSGDTAPGANQQGSIDFYDELAAEGAGSTHLPLSHEVWKYAVDAAKNHTVAALDKAGIALLTVSQCLDMDPYEIVGPYGVRDASWTCNGPWTGPSTPTTTTSSTTTTTTTTSSAPTTTTSTTAAPLTASSTTTTTTSSAPTTTTSSTTTTTSSTSATTSSAPTTTTSTTAAPLTASSTTTTTTSSTTTTTTSSAPTTTTSTTAAPLTASSTTTTTTPPATTPPPCKETYRSDLWDTCGSIESKFNLQEGTIKAANTLLTCAFIWPHTRICVPDGPYKSPGNGGSEPSCAKENYKSAAGDTCASIETKFALQAGSVAAANGGVNCASIKAGTKLSICVPTLVASDARKCSKRVITSARTTCAALGAANGVSAGWIKAWNTWVNCAEILTWTTLCVAH